jgi:hypothetical protein
MFGAVGLSLCEFASNNEARPNLPHTVKERRIYFTFIDSARRRHKRAFNQAPEDRDSANARECPACLGCVRLRGRADEQTTFAHFEVYCFGPIAEVIERIARLELLALAKIKSLPLIVFTQLA